MTDAEILQIGTDAGRAVFSWIADAIRARQMTDAQIRAEAITRMESAVSAALSFRARLEADDAAARAEALAAMRADMQPTAHGRRDTPVMGVSVVAPRLMPSCPACGHGAHMAGSCLGRVADQHGQSTDGTMRCACELG